MEFSLTESLYLPTYDACFSYLIEHMPKLYFKIFSVKLKSLFIEVTISLTSKDYL